MRAFRELRFHPAYSEEIESAPIKVEIFQGRANYLRAEVSSNQLVTVSDRRRVRVRQDGYGSRLPTDRAAFVAGRWRRVWVICWSNAGSCYVDLTKAERAHWPGQRICILGGML